MNTMIYRALPAPPIGSCRKGRRGGADSIFWLKAAPARFWGRRCGPVLSPEPKIIAGPHLGGISGLPMEML
jgi:hypothetical protein